ncbi:MAG TPA: hypothetical protein VNJ51_02030 [Candidatus Dormibacteraeota bacterium]|nr:hypothetical protein [Candidatus Dormibacteraeota bacterium]
MTHVRNPRPRNETITPPVGGLVRNPLAGGTSSTLFDGWGPRLARR